MAFFVFRYSAGLILLITAVAKIVSAFGEARVLQQYDPILFVSYRSLLLVAGILEAIAGIICLSNRRLGFAIGSIAFMATNLVLYRISLWVIGYHSPCSCLGNLTDALHIAPQTADTAMKIILAYLLIGSYGTLFWLWRQQRKA